MQQTINDQYPLSGPKCF